MFEKDISVPVVKQIDDLDENEETNFFGKMKDAITFGMFSNPEKKGKKETFERFTTTCHVTRKILLIFFNLLTIINYHQIIFYNFYSINSSWKGI